MYFSSGSDESVIKQLYHEEFNKSIIYSNPELQEIDIEKKRVMIPQQLSYLNYSDILPSNHLSFDTLKKFNLIMNNHWETERNETEWQRIEYVKRLYVAIQKDLIDLKYP